MIIGGKQCLCVAALGILSLAGSASAAAIVFNDFGPGNAYNCCIGYTLSGSTSGIGTFGEAAAFTPSTNFQLAEIDIALGHVSGTNSAIVTLNSDNSGLPGSVLETWDISSLPAFGSCCTVEVLTDVLNLNLVASTQYWIVAQPGASDTWDAWNWNSAGATGLHSESSGGVFPAPSEGTLGAFAVLSTAPEPTTLLLSGCGLGLLLVGLLKRR